MNTIGWYRLRDTGIKSTKFKYVYIKKEIVRIFKYSLDKISSIFL